MNVAKIRIFRRLSGEDRIKNEHLRDNIGVKLILNKLREQAEIV